MVTAGWDCCAVLVELRWVKLKPALSTPDSRGPCHKPASSETIDSCSRPRRWESACPVTTKRSGSPSMEGGGWTGRRAGHGQARSEPARLDISVRSDPLWPDNVNHSSSARRYIGTAPSRHANAACSSPLLSWVSQSSTTIALSTPWCTSGVGL